jgi:hypothetical protein
MHGTRREWRYTQNHRVHKREDSFLFKFPKLMLLWDFERNTVDPYTLSPFSLYRAHWSCSLGHSSVVTVKRKVAAPYCYDCERLFTPIEGSLYELYPKIAKEWDYEKNFPLQPNCIKPRHATKVAWKCASNHSYWASPDNRVGQHSGCPFCWNGGTGRPKIRRWFRKPK